MGCTYNIINANNYFFYLKKHENILKTGKKKYYPIKNGNHFEFNVFIPTKITNKRQKENT